MEDISINSVRENVVLPVQKAGSSKVAKHEQETKVKNIGSNNEFDKSKNVSLDIQSTIEQVREFAKTFTPKLSFSVDPKSKESIIFVTEKETGKIIRQIPPEEMQKMTERLNEIVGILYNRRV